MLFGARGGGSDVSHVDDALYRRDKPGGTVGYPAQPGYTCFAWAGGTFFPVVLLCCVSFWFWWEMCFGLNTHVLRVQ